MGQAGRRTGAVGESGSPITGLVYWVLLTGHRGVIALAMSVGFAAFFTLLVSLEGVQLTHSQPLFYAYSGLIAGNLTLVTVIVSINQLFLSRELQSPGELQSQIDDIVAYRAGIEDATGRIAPATPLDFLRLLVEATRQTAQRVGGYVQDGDVQARDRELDEVVETLTAQMDEIDATLSGADPDTFKVLSVMLGSNYAEHIYKLREIRAEHTDGMDDAIGRAINDLIDRLSDMDVSRQYFRSIYLQEELSDLSRILLYAGLPSVVISVAALVVLAVPPDAPETVVALEVLLPGTLTVGLVPLAILGAYFLRTATVTKLTAATVPFSTPEDSRL